MIAATMRPAGPADRSETCPQMNAEALVPDARNGLIAERAYLELRDRIVTLRLPPGSVLREDALMRELGIGRTPLREAVKRLALENLVSVQPRRGTSVTAVDVDDIAAITEVRVELEAYAAELAAQRIDDAAREEARALLAQIGTLDGQGNEALMRFDERIHRFVSTTARNPYLADSLDRYFALSLRVWHLVLDRVPALDQSVHDQQALLEALLAGDAVRARALMREHVVAFQREILAAFGRA